MASRPPGVIAATVSVSAFLDELGDLARRIAASAGVLAIEDKGETAFDPVTELDRGIEAAFRQMIARRFPCHRIWGEEEGWSGPPDGPEWSIDPVDGTRALICGLPSWAVLVGLVERGDHVAGLVDLPALGERLVAADGRTLRNGQPAGTSGCRHVADARLATTDPYLFGEDERAGFEQVRSAVRLCRYGLDALGYARVATGELDLVVESGLKRHDYDALIPVVRGAGGHIGDWQGGSNFGAGRIVAAASRQLYEETVALLAS